MGRVATGWNPEISKALREDKKQLAKLNLQITESAKNLAELMKRRQDICEMGHLGAYEDYDFFDWVHKAAKCNNNYQQHTKRKLQLLGNQYDSKYWPENHEVIAAIGIFAQESEINETNRWTQELLTSPKHSVADYIRVILLAIKERKKYGPPDSLLPEGFHLSDMALATFVNCTLDKAPDKLLSSENIKRSRQNIRKYRPSE